MQSSLNDLDFVKYFLTRENFENDFSLCDTNLLCLEAQNVLKSLPEYYQANPEHTPSDVSSFGAWFLQFYIAAQPIDYKRRHQAWLRLVKARPDTAQSLLIKAMRTKSIAKELQTMAMQGLTSEKLKDLSDKLEQVTAKTDELEDLICDTPFNDLFDHDEFTNGLKWPLECLNRSINALPAKGFFMVAAARPGACKSSFVLQCAVNFAKQMQPGEVVIWFNNEGSVEEMKRRFLTTVLQKDRETLMRMRQNSKSGLDLDKELDKALGGTKFIFVELAHRGITEAEKVLKRYKASVRLIVVDMLDNVNTRSQLRHMTNTDSVSGLLYQWWLGAACLYAPVIGTSQMNKTEDPRFPKLEDLVGSKNLKQGAVSCQLMIGHEEQSEMRYLSTPKNKYGKGGTTWSATVRFDSDTNSFTEV